MLRPRSKLLFAAAIVAVPLAGCSTPEKPMVSSTPTQTAPALSATDTTFFDQASRSGTEEVNFGQLARQHATRASTRAYAERMVEAHTPVNQQIAQLAASKSVTPPTTMEDAHQEMYDRLSRTRGRAFDRAYLNGQAADHAATLQNFQNEAQSGVDPDVKAFAARNAPDIQSHLDMARRLGGRVASVTKGDKSSFQE